MEILNGVSQERAVSSHLCKSSWNSLLVSCLVSSLSVFLSQFIRLYLAVRLVNFISAAVILENEALTTETLQYNCSIKYRGNSVHTGLSRGLKFGSPTTGLICFRPANSEGNYLAFNSLANISWSDILERIGVKCNYFCEFNFNSKNTENPNMHNLTSRRRFLYSATRSPANKSRPSPFTHVSLYFRNIIEFYK
jgi:hypothetical protein